MKKALLVFLQIFFVAFSANAQNRKVISTYVESRNIYIRYSDNTTKQLTFSNSDTNPFILQKDNSILFIRDAYGDVDNPKAKKIMKVNWNNSIEKTITAKKPFQDGLSATYYILSIENPTLSLDEKYIYFITNSPLTA